MDPLQEGKQYISDQYNNLSGVNKGDLWGGNTINYSGQSYKVIDNGNGTRSFQRVAPGGEGGGGIGMGGFGIQAAVPTLDLPSLYQKFYDSSGIKTLQDKLAQEEQGFNTAQSQINDNPFLSEGNRTGRVQKLQTDYNNATAGDRNDIATRKADLQLQLDLATKQFDINSQQVRDAQQQFNNLLSVGALDNASAEDIAGITKSTGIPSNIIYSAIQSRINSQRAQSEANAPKPQVITSTDNNGNVTISTIDSRTGKLINQQSLGQVGSNTIQKIDETATSKSLAKTSANSSNKPLTATTQTSMATSLVQDYIRDRKAQAAASPEDFLTLLKAQYPSAKLPSASDIRKITKQ